MNWLTPGIETTVAYATCMLLFGLLVLSVRNRKIAARASYTFHDASVRSIRRYAATNKSTRSPQRATAPVQKSGRLLNTGFDAARREQANAKAPESSANLPAAPLQFTAAQISDEVKMSSPSFPFESLDPIALARLSALAKAAKALAIEKHIAAPPNASGPAEMEKPSTRDIAIAPNAPAADESALAASAPAERNGTALGTMEESAMFPQAQPFTTTSEKKPSKNLLEFYGLRQQPFDITPDPSFLYFSPSHREALTSLKQGIEHFRGFMMLVAEPGMGKTTLMNKLMEELSDSARVVFLFQTQCSSHELLCFILNELEVDHAGMDVVAMHRALNQALLEEMLRGRRFVLIVDEAQNLQEPVLETIRLLSDFETTHSKLIQIVLAGQPQLAETLMRDSLVQLRQRVAVLSSLKPLTAAETAEYVDYRMRWSGWNGEHHFTSAALAQIAESSEGIPRRINNLCFNALLEGFQRGLQIINADIVKEVAGKLNVESLVRRPQPVATSQPTAAPAEAATTAQLAHDLAAALTAEAHPNTNAETLIEPKPKPDVVLTGNLTEKVRSQGWSKQHEYRILVTLERDPVNGLPVADRYYCCSMYMDAEQASMLKAGKPVRIKIEQD